MARAAPHSGGAAGSAGAAGSVIGATNCPDVGLAAADPFPNVVADVAGGDVRIRFDPLEKAQDYRVYVLPKQGDVAGDSVKNATYRCAGNYEVPLAGNEDQPVPNGGAIRTRIASKVQNFARAASDATLGYVFTTPSADRIPVYALGDPDVDSDNVACYFARWPESRVKAYITSDDDRTKRLDQHWRDHGVAFYAPKPGATGTTQVYLASDTAAKPAGPLYVTPGAEYDARKMARQGHRAGLRGVLRAASRLRAAAAHLLRTSVWPRSRRARPWHGALQQGVQAGIAADPRASLQRHRRRHHAGRRSIGSAVPLPRSALADVAQRAQRSVQRLQRRLPRFHDARSDEAVASRRARSTSTVRGRRRLRTPLHAPA